MICLLPNCSFLSETSRAVEIHRALTARGTQVRVATHGGTHEWVLREAGVPYDLLGPGLPAGRCAELVASVPGMGDPSRSMWTDQELRSMIAAEASYFRAHGVRGVVTGWTLSALLSSSIVGIPVIVEHAGSYVPPVWEHGLLPAPSAPVGLPMERFLPPAVKHWLINKPERLRRYTSGFNRVAAELGVPAIPSFPALLLGDLTLVTEIPEILGVPRSAIDGWRPKAPSRYRPNSRLRCTGPLYAKLTTPLPDRVRHLLTGPGPLVYVAITSSSAQLVRNAVAALRPLDARVLVTATVHDLADLDDDRVFVERVLPSHEVMRQVDLAVIAGGQGSVQTAVASGLPFIGLPLQPEQDTNIALVERLGAGRRLAPRHAATPALTRLADDMLHDPGYRSAAARLQALYARIDGAGAAADAVLEYIAERPARQSSPT